MAYASAVGVPSLFLGGRRVAPVDVRQLCGFPLSGSRAPHGRKIHQGVVAMATRDGSDSSSDSILDVVQNAWSNSDDRLAIIGVGFASIAVLWASSNIFTAIDTLPVVPSVFELIGILFSWWFIYRYLLFKPDREEFWKNLTASVTDILGR
ncbi:CURVATURE THYLAKOID protein [Wolffia australiana]